ncbi:gliding motility-associated C-terminal domain-containing protein [Pedobacter ginsengisoli]|uniref:gliding motility-associated C-terminal domain-containing protein n=1 Tax=Pedobacter ginsengisoli TaxID=363852 RepID=UPI00254AF1B1|nr:gliding motility-associated C-terminal domain-containing protein [Pedobacter ginsengisoli]
MLQALNHISGILKLRTLILFLILACIAEKGNAQADPEPHFRITNYDSHTINGFAPAGSTIKLYYADSASFTPRTGVPFATVVTDGPPYFVWQYTRGNDHLGDFDGPVVVSMTRPGSAEVIFESSLLGADEVKILNFQPCAETQTIWMFPGAGDVFTWRDERGDIKSHDQLLRDAPPGKYTLEYKNIAGRLYRSEPVLVEEPPRAVSDNITLQCGELFREYEGQYTGTAASFLWENQASGATMTGDRVRLSPGAYNFYVTSPGGCRSDPAIITVRAAPVLARIDVSSNIQVTKTKCTENTGSITGVRVIPAPNQTPNYRWRDTVGNEYPVTDIQGTIDIYNLAAGKYTLEAYTDNNSCPTILLEEEIEVENGITLTLNPEIPQVQPSCGLGNGSITGLSATNATSFEWYKGDDRTTPVSRELELHNASPGFYTLILKNEFGCTHEYSPHFFEIFPAVELLTPPVMKSDTCSLGKGSLTGPVFNTSVTYIWRNEAGEEVGNRNSDLLNVPAGNYTLTASNSKCQNTFPFTIGNTQTNIVPPLMEDILICAPSSVNISFKETAEIYRIYNASGTLLSQSSSKDFRIRVDQPGIYYAALGRGSCESPRTMFSIGFGSSGLQIPTAFSPNGDGINDNWMIKGIEVYTTPEVKLFNRQGMMVFHSFGRSQPFDGKSKGADLPVGVYYYMVRPSIECPPQNGSLTLIR